MDTSDRAEGFRAVAGTRLRLAVAMKPQAWDESYVFDVPMGYHWASTAEVVDEAKTSSEAHDAYYDQAGWDGTEWPPGSGQSRRGFVCTDSVRTGKTLRAGWPVRTHAMDGTAFHARGEYFAGLVCIRNADPVRYAISGKSCCPIIQI